MINIVIKSHETELLFQSILTKVLLKIQFKLKKTIKFSGFEKIHIL